MALAKCPECSEDISDQAGACPSCGYPLRRREGESEFRAFRKRILVGCLVMCVIALPVGVAMALPHVWGLALAGIAISATKLGMMRRQYLSQHGRNHQRLGGGQSR